PLEVGTVIPAGPETFTWSTSNPQFISMDSISIVDTTASQTLAANLPNTGTANVTISLLVNNIPALQTWTINGVDTSQGSFGATFMIQWLYRIFAGTSTNTELTGTEINALSFSALQAGFAGTYAVSSVPIVYYYFSMPDSMGSVSTFVDGNTGFPISMATNADDPFYANVANGFNYALVPVTNVNGLTVNYKLYRTQNDFSGTLEVVVT